MTENLIATVKSFMVDARPADLRWLLGEGRIRVSVAPITYAELTDEAKAMVTAKLTAMTR